MLKLQRKDGREHEGQPWLHRQSNNRGMGTTLPVQTRHKECPIFLLCLYPSFEP
jgi:hypothetical protein